METETEVEADSQSNAGFSSGTSLYTSIKPDPGFFAENLSQADLEALENAEKTPRSSLYFDNLTQSPGGCSFDDPTESGTPNAPNAPNARSVPRAPGAPGAPGAPNVSGCVPEDLEPQPLDHAQAFHSIPNLHPNPHPQSHRHPHRDPPLNVSKRRPLSVIVPKISTEIPTHRRLKSTNTPYLDPADKFQTLLHKLAFKERQFLEYKQQADQAHTELEECRSEINSMLTCSLSQNSSSSSPHSSNTPNNSHSPARVIARKQCPQLSGLKPRNISPNNVLNLGLNTLHYTKRPNPPQSFGKQAVDFILKTINLMSLTNEHIAWIPARPTPMQIMHDSMNLA